MKLVLFLGTIWVVSAVPAHAVVYCKTVGVPKGCVARPGAAGVGAGRRRGSTGRRCHAGRGRGSAGRGCCPRQPRRSGQPGRNRLTPLPSGALRLSCEGQRRIRDEGSR